MRRIFGRGRYANVTSTMALVLALGGTSYAAIKLPANSVTSKTVKDKSLLKKDFKAGQLPAGKAGAIGATGAKGDPGPQGPAGTNATTAGFSASTAGTIGLGAGVTVQSLSLPAGKYIIAAHAMAHNDAANDVNVKCSLSAGGTEIDSLGGVGVDVAPAPPVADTSINLDGAAALGSAGTATLVCTASPATGNFLQRNITAVQVGTLNGA